MAGEVLRKIVTEFVFRGDTLKIEKFDKSVAKMTNSLKAMDSDVKKVENSFTKNLNPALKKTGILLGTYFGTKLLFSKINEFTKLSQDAGETLSKFNVVFSNISKDAENMSKVLVKSFGLGRTESKKLLSDTGDLLTGFGFTQQQALSLSGEVQKLAVDLASFTNIEGGATRASEAITRALLGEREMVKALGVAVLEEDIKREASLRGLGKQLTRQQKAEITLALIMRQSQNAIGDYARTSDSAANRNKLLTTRIIDLKEKIGAILLPIREFVVNGLLFIVNGMEKVGQAIKVLIYGLGTLGIAFTILKAKAVGSAIAIAGAWAKANATILLIPALWLAVAGAIGLVVEDIISYFKGENSLTGIIVASFKDLILNVDKLIRKFGNDVLTVLNWLVDKILDIFAFFGKILYKILVEPFEWIFTSIDKIGGKILNLYDKTKGAIKDFVGGDNEKEIILKKINEFQGGIQNFPQSNIPNNITNSNTNNNKTINSTIQSPQITINVNNNSNSSNIIQDIKKGVQNGLQSTLNQSLRAL